MSRSPDTSENVIHLRSRGRHGVADEKLMDDRVFAERLREVGARRYHDRHPFHVRMNAGELSNGQIRASVANRLRANLERLSGLLLVALGVMAAS